MISLRCVAAHQLQKQRQQAENPFIRENPATYGWASVVRKMNAGKKLWFLIMAGVYFGACFAEFGAWGHLFTC